MTRLETTLRGVWRTAERAVPGPVIDAIARSSLPRATVAGLLTSRPARFAACELRGGRRLRRHDLRGGRWAFCVHHGTPDASVLAEVFRAGYYRLPPDVEQHFGALDRPLRVADLGAHVGLFGLWVLQRFADAEIVAFEPDPLNFAALSGTIRENGPHADRWRAIQACAAATDGRVSFAPGGSSSAHVVRPGDETEGVVSVPARDVFPHLEEVDLLKIDIEGSEWELLGDPRFAEVAPTILFLEYHPHLCPADDPRAYALATLRDMGYEVTEVFAAPEGVGLVRAARQPEPVDRRQ